MITTIYVQFRDSQETEIISVFGGEQSSDIYSNLGTVQSDDSRYEAFYNNITDPLGLIKPGD